MVLGTSAVQMTLWETEASWPGEEGERGPAGPGAGWETAECHSLLTASFCPKLTLSHLPAFLPSRAQGGQPAARTAACTGPPAFH